MTEKILILNRKKNTLEIQDEDNCLCFSYLVDITHIEKDETDYGANYGIFDVFNGKVHKGFITDVKEIKEEW